MKYLLIFLLSINCFAEDISYLKKGEVAPFDGVLFSKEKELQLRQLKYDKDATQTQNKIMQQIIDQQEKEINIQSKRIEVYQNQANVLAKDITDYKTNRFWQNTVYFIAGVAITGLVTYGVLQTTRYR